jgi:hypothetical protein
MLKKFTALAVVGTGLIGSWASAQDYSTISLGPLTTNQQLKKTVADYSLIDASLFTSTAVGDTTATAVKVVSGNSSLGVANVNWQGGLIIGSIPTSWDWTTTHDYGGSGVRIENSGPIEYRYVRVHNVEDGVKTREVPEYGNTGSWSVHDSYFTAIRDDAVENDRFEPGSISNSLFDGVFVFYSEQNENVGTSTAIASNEKDTVEVDGVLVRIYPTNNNEVGGGKWFKIQGRGAPNHRVLVSNSVFAIGAEPRSGWYADISPSIEWVGSNNYILWLGVPGAYQGPRPSKVTFLEGAAAEEKWVSMRNDWLVRHGLAAQDLPADYNPHTAPLVRVPLVSNPTPPPTVVPPTTVEPLPSDTGTLTVTAAEDTYVVSGSSSAKGTATTLQVDTNPQTEAYLKYNIPGISGSVTSAKLRVYVTNSSKDAPKVKLVENDWDESSLVYANNQPLIIDNISVADMGSVSKGKYVDYDVTSMIQTNGTLSFGFFPDSSDGMDFYSKEATSASPPQLIIEFAN